MGSVEIFMVYSPAPWLCAAVEFVTLTRDLCITLPDKPQQLTCLLYSVYVQYSGEWLWI